MTRVAGARLVLHVRILVTSGAESSTFCFISRAASLFVLNFLIQVKVHNDSLTATGSSTRADNIHGGTGSRGFRYGTKRSHEGITNSRNI